LGGVFLTGATGLDPLPRVTDRCGGYDPADTRTEQSTGGSSNISRAARDSAYLERDSVTSWVTLSSFDQPDRAVAGRLGGVL
jgi:hypothetical protein